MDHWVDLAIADVQQGMLIEIRPGEKVAVDGEVVCWSKLYR